MKAQYLHSAHNTLLYCITDTAVVSIINSKTYASISTSTDTHDTQHMDLTECSATEFNRVRTQVLERLGMKQTAFEPNDFRLSYLADFTGI